MIFEDITPFENMSDEELRNMIVTPQRRRSFHKNLRSFMMVNPLKIKHLNTIDNLEADVVVLNLEDGVAPSMKKRALLLTAIFLSHLKKSYSRIIVRVNPIDEGGDKEIKFLNSLKPDAIRVAKVRTVDDIKKVLEILDEEISLHISVETKESLKNLSKLNINNKVSCASLGIMDMLHDLGLPQHLLKLDNPTIHYILSRFLVDSKIAGIYPIGFTYQKYNDTDTFKQWCLFEQKLGFKAKSCLGPKQVSIVNEVFSDTQEEKERALYIKNLFEKMREKDITGFMDDKYGFIDEPIYKDALLTLEKLSIK